MFRKLFESTQNLQLNNTFKTYQHLCIYRAVELFKCHKPSTDVSKSASCCNLYRFRESKGSELESSLRPFQEFDNQWLLSESVIASGNSTFQ